MRRRFRRRTLALFIGGVEGPPRSKPSVAVRPHGLLLCKLGERQWMNALVEQGEVYMQRLSNFRKLEHAEIGDRDEGSSARFTEDNSTLRVFATIDQKRILLRTESLRLYGPEQHHAVYCMYGLVLPQDGILRGEVVTRIARDKRLRSMGDTLITFKDPAEFENRLLEKAKQEGFNLALRQVEYLPAAHCGEWTWYQKVDRYRHQAEWRIITTTPIRGDSLTLRLGSLEDIALCYDLTRVDVAGASEEG